MLRNVQRAALLRETVGVVDSPNMVAQPCFYAGGRSLSIRQASAPSFSRKTGVRESLVHWGAVAVGKGCKRWATCFCCPRFVPRSERSEDVPALSDLLGLPVTLLWDLPPV
jgi:hypothetical protein